MTKDEKLLLDENFKGLTSLMNAHFINSHERMDEIIEQTTKTNRKVQELEKDNIRHLITCPQIPKIEKINEDLQEYRVFLKHPKVFIAAISISVLMMISSGVITSKKLSQNKIINYEMITKLDSLNKTINFNELIQPNED